jgi:hypothetical protein
LLGYLGTRGAVLVEQQVPYVISGGLVGIFLLAVGAVLWLSADLRDDWRELREVKINLERIHDLESRRDATAAIPVESAPAEPVRASNGDTRRRSPSRPSRP